MDEILEHLEGLYDKDTKRAYAHLQALIQVSQTAACVYPYWDTFVKMIEDPNGYIRTRGLLLMAENARWDTENKMDASMDLYLTHLTDPKPIISRQCIQALPLILEAKKDLVPVIQQALMKANPAIYKESMRPLVAKDIASVLKYIES